MTFFNYNIDIPAALDDPSVDQPLMLTNTNTIGSWVNIDHHGFGDNLGGYHRVIHQDTGTITRINGVYANVPAAILVPTPINQIFPASVTTDSTTPQTDTQLFAMTANGDALTGNGIYQMTGNTGGTEGYTWVAGILVQWGFVASGVVNGGTVTFKGRTPTTIPFPNTLYTVYATPTYNTTAPPNNQFPTQNSTISIDTNVANTNNLQFKYTIRQTASATNYTGFYWLAIGN